MKLKIALRNLFISQAVIVIFLIFAYFVWFPFSFSTLEEFYKTAGLIIFVDVILGPLLVYIIYKENKKFLRFDINVLLGIQIVAFAFGAYSLYLKHPVYAVFSIDRFTLVNAANTTPEKIRFDSLKSSIFSKTKITIAKMPSDIEKKNALTLGVLFNGAPDLEYRAEYYQPFNQNISDVLKKSINLKKFSKLSKNKIRAFANKHKGNISDYAYFPLRTKYKDLIWVLNKNNALPVGIVDINPWLLNEKVSSTNN